MAESCAHCRSFNIQQQVHSFQCLDCGRETRSDGAPIKPPLLFPAPGNLERQRISAPWEPDTHEDFVSRVEAQGETRQVAPVMQDRPTWEEDDLKALGEG